MSLSFPLGAGKLSAQRVSVYTESRGVSEVAKVCGKETEK